MMLVTWVLYFGFAWTRFGGRLNATARGDLIASILQLSEFLTCLHVSCFGDALVR